MLVTATTALYREFNCFDSPEKTTETTSTFADVQGLLRKRTNRRRFPRARLISVRPGRCNEWWNNFITQRVTADEWKENFRMNRETFLKLCDDLSPSLEH